MEEGGYAANGIKHCVRPVDMAGKSAGLILRRINPAAWRQAEQAGHRLWASRACARVSKLLESRMR